MKNLLFIVAVLACFVSCRADDDVKQGGQDDFCNFRDTDCRDGFICQAGVCQALVNTGVYSCGDICNRLDACGATEANCVARCQATFEGTCSGLPCPWSSDAIDDFGTCIVEGLTCDEIRGGDATTLCFQEIDTPAARAERCDGFIAAARRCDPNADVTGLRARCGTLAATATDESWMRTDACVERIVDGFCDEIADCFNSVFELNPALAFEGIGGNNSSTNNFNSNNGN